MIQMPRLVRHLPLLAAGLALLPAAAAAQADSLSTITVVVRAVEGGVPVRGARVQVLGARIAANADSAGVARLRVPSGPRIMSVHKLGYGDERFPLTVPAGDTLTVEVDLQAEAVRLAEIRATSFRSRVLSESGFLARQRTGLGSYATRADWQGRGRLQFTDVIRRMRGVRVTRTSDGRNMISPGRGTISMSSMCRGVLVFVNGVELPVDAGFDDINDLVPLSELEAVETYGGVGAIPPQFNRTGSACGVIVAWRRGAG